MIRPENPDRRTKNTGGVYMKLMKRLIAVGITALMLISQFAMTAFADTPATKDWMDPFDNAENFPQSCKSK